MRENKAYPRHPGRRACRDGRPLRRRVRQVRPSQVVPERQRLPVSVRLGQKAGELGRQRNGLQGVLLVDGAVQGPVFVGGFQPGSVPALRTAQPRQTGSSQPASSGPEDILEQP